MTLNSWIKCERSNKLTDALLTWYHVSIYLESYRMIFNMTPYLRETFCHWNKSMICGQKGGNMNKLKAQAKRIIINNGSQNCFITEQKSSIDGVV